jgi:hypothetical protein
MERQESEAREKSVVVDELAERAMTAGEWSEREDDRKGDQQRGTE